MGIAREGFGSMVSLPFSEEQLSLAKALLQTCYPVISSQDLRGDWFWKQ